MTTKPEMTAADIAKAVAGGKLSALDATEAALARINLENLASLAEGLRASSG